MKKLIPIILIFAIWSCQTEPTQNDVDLSDINLFLETDLEIDSVFFSNITQDREFFYLPYTNPLKIKLNDSINDLYNLHFYTKQGRISDQLWLNGKNVIIKGKLTDELEIDTVIGSDMYYTSIEVINQFNELISRNSDSTTIDNFLIKKLNENIKSPFSINIATQFLYRNINDKDRSRILFDILKTQSDEIKKHRLNVYTKIIKILNTDKVDISKYQFYDVKNSLASISLEKGKIYLLDFWFLNCPPCIQEHKIISQKIDLLKQNNIELIGISTDSDHDKWLKYLKNHDYDWRNYRVNWNGENVITSELLISMYPTYILINDKGTYLLTSNSFDKVENYIKNNSL